MNKYIKYLKVIVIVLMVIPGTSEGVKTVLSVLNSIPVSDVVSFVS